MPLDSSSSAARWSRSLTGYWRGLAVQGSPPNRLLSPLAIGGALGQVSQGFLAWPVVQGVAEMYV
ncbi:hypothetical protein DP939_33315 [Spongiactinospora rosea]|uniref:Uncharacterized protein n=1 Tax=Spongiactinospora rosea TaxID=2248750 RepID=A0A366LPY4_9ACTN|nr:hypothetical protein DP939_33315 [Spongiactinospora rosea]